MNDSNTKTSQYSTFPWEGFVYSITIIIIITAQRYYNLIISSLYIYYKLCLCVIDYIMFVNEGLF